MIRLIILFILYISNICFANFIFDVSDLQEDIYLNSLENGQNEYVLKIPVIIHSVSDTLTDIYLTANTGGIKRKNRNQYLNKSEDFETDQEQFLNLSNQRFLRSGNTLLPYKLKAFRESFFEIFEDIIHFEDHVLQIYKEDFSMSYTQIKKFLYITIQPDHLKEEGLFTDIVTLFLYENEPNYENKLLIQTAQFKINLVVRDQNFLESYEIKPLDEDKYIYVLSVSIKSKKRSQLIIRQVDNDNNILLMTDGVHNFDETSRCLNIDILPSKNIQQKNIVIKLDARKENLIFDFNLYNEGFSR